VSTAARSEDECGGNMERTALLSEIRESKQRFVSLCYRFQELRARCVQLWGDLEATSQTGDSAVLHCGALPFPIYSFVCAGDGVLPMVRRPPIEGGSDRQALHCWMEAAPEAILVHVAGDVDLATAPYLANAIAAAFWQGPRVIIDLADVVYIDGSGIHVLTRAAESDKACLAVAGLRPHVRRLFEIMQLTDVVPLVDSMEA
jgi:anti-sigma B factor antagonist